MADSEHLSVASEIEKRLLAAGANSMAIPVDDFYELAKRDRLTEKFLNGVKDACEEKRLLVSFGEKVVAVMRDVVH